MSTLKEHLCPLCCENKTRGMICRDCELKLPPLDAGKPWTIRGMPAHDAKCPNEARARVIEESSSDEQLYVLQFEATTVEFICRTCGKRMVLKKPELGYTSNTFCPACDRQYWVDWHAGVLHMGLDDDQIYLRVMSRMSREIRMQGAGRRLT